MGGKGQLLHPDFGPSDDPDHPYGIVYNVVDGSYPKLTVDFSYADESEAGLIDHAIRVTAEQTDQRFVWPARHQSGARPDPTLPPMGARFRLKRQFPMAGLHPETRIVLRAMKRYGLIVADNGSNWFFGGAEDLGWPDRVIDELKSIPAARFEAVAAGRMKVSPDSARVRPRYVGV